MKSKEDILNKYYTSGADGMPEISSDALLKAMEEYSQLSEEAAFNAARQEQNGEYIYADYADYKTSTEQPLAEPSEADRVKFVAESIVEQFLPSDPAIQHFSFPLRTAGKEYIARYVRNADGYWEYESYI